MLLCCADKVHSAAVWVFSSSLINQWENVAIQFILRKPTSHACNKCIELTQKLTHKQIEPLCMWNQWMTSISYKRGRSINEEKIRVLSSAYLLVKNVEFSSKWETKLGHIKLLIKLKLLSYPSQSSQFPFWIWYKLQLMVREAVGMHLWLPVQIP